MSTPRVSVITPTRNRAKLLPRAIASVRGQTFSEWEVIVVDDASTDRTGEVLRNAAVADARVRSVRLDRPAGGAVARNRAIGEARSELVAFLDDDDEWLPEKLERQVAALALAPPDAALVHSSFVELDEQGRGRVAGAIDWAERDPADTLPRGNVLGLSTVVARRALLDDVGGFDERLPRLQDWDLWIRVATRARFVHVPTPLARIHVTRGSISSDSDALRSACAIIAAKHERAGALDGARRADLFFALAHLLLRHGQVPDARELLRRSLRLRPWPPRRIVLASLALLDPRLYALAVRAHERLAGSA